MLLKILKISLLGITGILLVLLAFGIVLIFDWPWWVGFFLLLAIVGFGIGIIFFRKLWLRRREQEFVQQVIAQDEARLKKAKDKEKDELQNIQARWKEAVDALRRSHLRKYGNPLYVLPWYLIIGESGSGKTTSIKSARLSSPFIEVTRTPGISGTRNCDWWFFEQAIIIDTAGRYAIPADEGRDKEEWQKFLHLLVKYRKKEPLHGLIVTVAADKLLGSSSEALAEDGKKIRHRIDELMRVLGVKFPVYLLVTKCDLIQGMTKLCDKLSEKSAEQAMGAMNQDLSTDIEAFLNHAFSTIGDRLRNLRLILLNTPEYGETDTTLLLFPEEFGNLKDGLMSFMKVAFQENPYQETPVLRGLYFSSGRQEGSPYSRFLSTLGLIGEKEVLPGTSKGLFLHDFFSKILPKDRRLFAPTRRAVEWQTLTRNLGLVSWVVIGVAICGLLSFSFVKNLKTLREASHQFAKPPALQKEFMADLVTMNHFNNAVLKVVEQNRDWWIPRFGLTESIYVEKGLKAKFCDLFQNDFIAPLDNRMKESFFINVNKDIPDADISRYIVYLTRRINLLKARLKGLAPESIKAMPQPPFTSLLSAVGEEIGQEARQTFGQLYTQYIIWRPDLGEISREIDIIQSWLKPLLALKAPVPHWIVTWINRNEALPSITLGDFWEGRLPAKDEITIAPAYTRSGKEKIDSLITEIESALPDPLIFAGQKEEFYSWYRSRSLKEWQAFASEFPSGKERLKSKEEWRKIAAKIATDEGPYFAFISKITTDLEFLGQQAALPIWLKQLYAFQAVKEIGDKGKGTAAKATEKGMEIVSSIEEKFGKDEEGTSAKRLMAVGKYRQYLEALNSIRAVAASRKQAYDAALQVFTEDQAISKSPFYAAYDAASGLKVALTKEKTSDTVWNLIRGPFEYLWEYTLMETACSLQTQWEEGVLAEAQGASGEEAVELLLGKDGFAWKFVKKPAAPFIEYRQINGYQAKKVLGRTVPIKPSFFSFLNRGAGAHADAITRQTYNVVIAGLPTESNPDAALKPQATHLEIQCADDRQVLHNYNFPVKKTFKWSPRSCGDVILKIDVGTLVLTKHYRRAQAFIDFLEDFKTGSHTFYPNEFPSQSASLKDMRIKTIKVNYKFTGADAVREKFRSRPEVIVRSIADCWEQ